MLLDERCNTVNWQDTYELGERFSSDTVLRNRASLTVGGLLLLDDCFDELPAGDADGIVVAPDGAMEAYARELAACSVGGAKDTGGAATEVMAAVGNGCCR
jgi:hypothetical protein